jgi:hypothetical protein
MAFWAWSRTAASNGNADSTINYLEGQAPSTLNDSARALMARVAEYRDDMAGAITTGGTSTAYTLTTFEVFDTLAHLSGNIVGFTVHANNGASPTLNVDSLGAKALRAATGVALAANQLISGSPYVALYNNSNSEFIIIGGVVRSVDIPQGTLMLFQQTSAPTGWTKQTTHDDKALRVVSGTASSGGTSAFSTVFGLTATSGHTIIMSELPSGVIALGGSSRGPTSTSPFEFTLPNSALGSTDNAHTHPIELRVKYVDLIIASKD